jgi:hypothetical protein
LVFSFQGELLWQRSVSAQTRLTATKSTLPETINDFAIEIGASHRFAAMQWFVGAGPPKFRGRWRITG